MGIAGTLDYISDLIWKVKRRRKKKQIQTVNLKIRMDCEGCRRKIKHVLSAVKGVKSVDIDMKQQKVSVTGRIEPNKVLKAAQATKKRVEIWPYTPYTLVGHPYMTGAYDKKAPANMVRKLPAANEMTVADQYAIMFSDDNTNACSVM